MNKKFLSTLLMGALFIASVSVFTSCKDYDEDIQNLQTQVDGLKSDLNKRIDDLTAKQEQCKSDCAAAQAALAKDIEDLKKLHNGDIDKLNKAIEDAIKGAKADNDALKTELEKAAQKYAADAAEKARAAAVEEAVGQAKAYAEQLRDELDAKKVDLVEFTAKVQDLEGKIAGLDGRLKKVEDALGAVTANTAAIEQMKTQINALEKFDEQVKKDFEGVNTEIGNVKKELEAQKKALEDQKKDLQGAIDAAKKDLQGQIDQLRKDLDNGATVASLTKRVETLETAALGINENAKAIDGIKTAMQEADKKIAEALAGAARVNVLDLYISKVLTSIYLKPEFFYSGIEAIELPALYDTPWNLVDKDKQLTLEEKWALDTKAAPIDVCKGGVAYYHLNPWNADIEGATVAFISNEAKTRAGANYGVNDLIKPVKETLDKDSWDKTFAGVLPVEFTGKFAEINALLKAGILPQVALNYKQTVDEKEINVSSDWALIAPTQYSELVIADKTWSNHEAILGAWDGTHEKTIDPAPECGHLTQDLVALADNFVPATHNVLWDGTLNLSELVRTHYSYSYRNAAGVEVKSEDKLMEDTIFKKFGLHYEFDLVQYTLGNNKTSESVHVVLEKNDKGETIARPVKVTEDGKSTNEQADKASVGRMPIVRVLLKTADNQVAAYAYMKLLISETEVPPIHEEATEDFKVDKDFYVDCEPTDPYTYTMTWSQVESRILSSALDGKYSKTTFEANWKLITDYELDNNKKVTLDGPIVGEAEDGTIALQFSEPKDDKYREVPVGEVALVQDNESGAHMQVLKWTITADDLLAMYAADNFKNVDPETGLNTNQLDVYVKFAGAKDVWVHFFIPAGKIHFAKASINNNKTLSYWFALNSSASGMKETHANVTVPNTQNDDCAFVWDILAAFDGYTIASSIDQKNFPNFAKAAKPEFFFTTPTTAAPAKNAEFNADSKGQWKVKGNSGAEYTLQVAADKKSVEAVAKDGKAIQATTIVKLVTPTVVPEGKEATESALEYQQNDVAFDLLNVAGHKELASLQTFTAYLQIKLVGACYDPFITDGSDYFNVKFLRPVDVEKTKSAEVQDAVDGGSKVNIMDLVSLVDWRDQSFTSANGLTDKDGEEPSVNYVKYETPHYINYYGVELAADVDNAMTDINKPEAEREVILEKAADIEKLVNLKKNSPACIFTFTPAPITWDGKKFVGGDIFYSNNSGNVKLFHIYVPLTISYKWGKDIKCGYGVITVKKTLNNSAKKF
jgi:predicted  nucleic acid-binding Zn-ribbon protein